MNKQEELISVLRGSIFNNLSRLLLNEFNRSISDSNYLPTEESFKAFAQKNVVSREQLIDSVDELIEDAVELAVERNEEVWTKEFDKDLDNIYDIIEEYNLDQKAAEGMKQLIQLV